jgi:hypothetical protein
MAIEIIDINRDSTEDSVLVYQLTSLPRAIFSDGAAKTLLCKKCVATILLNKTGFELEQFCSTPCVDFEGVLYSMCTGHSLQHTWYHKSNARKLIGPACSYSIYYTDV